MEVRTMSNQTDAVTVAIATLGARIAMLEAECAEAQRLAQARAA
jgi:hypothetical protein